MIQTARTVLALFVEGNGIVRLKLTGALEQEGWLVLWAGSVEEAVKLSENHQVDVLVVDLSQPLKPGLEFLRRLKGIHPGIPMVIITEQKTEFEAATAGRPVAVLERPFRVASLIHNLNVLLERQGQNSLPAAAGGQVASYGLKPHTSAPAQQARS